MSTFFQIASLVHETVELYGAGRFLEAAFTIERALEIAVRHSLEDDIVRTLTLAGYAWSAAGDERKALNAFLRIRDEYPYAVDVELERHIQTKSFSLVYKENPDLERLEERIRALDELSKSNGDKFHSDVCRLRNILYTGRGMWAAAIAEKEAQWTHRETDVVCEVCTLSDLVKDSLDAKERRKADLWLGMLRKTSTDSVVCQVNMMGAECYYGLCYGLPDEAEKLAERYDELASQMSHVAQRPRLKEMRIRSALLNRRLGDPANQLHPAFQFVTRRVERGKTRGEQFSRALLIADFRLACLRFAAGFAPVDDLYYTQGRETPTGLSVAPSEEINNRAKRVQAALLRARQSAAALDQAFRCSWRTEEIAAREERLKALITPLGQDSGQMGKVPKRSARL